MKQVLSSCGLVSGIALSLAAGSAQAYTPAEIDAAALIAHDVAIVSTIASDFYGGRNNDTPDSLAVQSLLVDELKTLGAGLNTAAIGDDAYKQPFLSVANGTNLLAVIPGSTLPGEYVMIGAHCDHLGTIGSEIFNGATDNAAGAAVVLAVGKAINALPTPPTRSVILALWDAEEDGPVGRVGSEYFSNNPLVPLSSIKGYVNLDIQGQNLVPALRRITFAIAAESGGSALQNMVDNASQASSLDLMPLTRIFGQERSDHASFIDDSIPAVFMSDATGSCYHTAGDDPSIVEMGKLAAQSEIAFRLMVELSEASVSPPWVSTLPLTVTFPDAVIMLEVLDRSIGALPLFPPATQKLIVSGRASVQAIVDAGPIAFRPVEDGNTLGLVALQLLGAVRNLPCDGFLPPELPASSTPIRMAVVGLLMALGLLVARRARA
jgi:hypothetical protein